MVNTTGPIARVEVTGDGAGVTGQAGTHLLGRIADRYGIAGGLSEVMADTTERSSAYDRGTVLVQLAMTIAGGGRCVSDLATLRDQPGLFGRVASTPTAWRTVTGIDDARRQAMVAVRQTAAQRVVVEAGIVDLDEVVLEVDATLVHLADETKQSAANTFKGGFGFAPMTCWIEPFGLPAGMLRPGNATANNVADQLAAIDEAIGCLPEHWQAGHRPGDDPDQVGRRVVVRGDTAAGTTTMLAGLAAHNVAFSVGMRATDAAAEVIKAIDDDVWRPAINTDGQVRDGAEVAEVKALVPDWAPNGTRAIVRRERPHPGANLRLWDYNGLRHQVCLTNDVGDPVDLELAHRTHAHVENRIKNLKDTGLSRLPFSSFDANRVWFELAMLAVLLLTALATHINDTDLAVAEPRRLRYTLLHVAARIVSHARKTILKLDRTWPWTDVLVAIHRRLDTPTVATAC